VPVPLPVMRCPRLKVIASVEAETAVFVLLRMLSFHRLKVIASVEAETTRDFVASVAEAPPQGHCFRGG